MRASWRAPARLDGLPYRFDVPRYDSTAYFIASAYPLEDVRVVPLFGHPLIVEARLVLPSRPIELWGRPHRGAAPVVLRRLGRPSCGGSPPVRGRGSAGLLLVGDFNATWGNRGFRAVLDTGLTDGAAARGHPFAMTWSQTKPLVPPLASIRPPVDGGRRGRGLGAHRSGSRQRPS